MVNWLQRVGSAIPRGFSRYYVLTLLKEQPMTGKQIMEAAAKDSDGIWKPSAGLVYPLLGRLLQEGLIEEDDNGKYRITEKGLETLKDMQSIQDVIKKQLDVLLRVGNIGRFVAADLLERLTSISATLSENLDKMTKEEREKYKEFLARELKKIEERERREKVDIE
ncbi:MAG: ParR family transcriptional regulator [Candidatus Nitrosocaldaceae archaeon]|nr:MAG: ParR family transcriptional regulator [Candidatus Nitrosocaldaceae archaeon]